MQLGTGVSRRFSSWRGALNVRCSAGRVPWLDIDVDVIDVMLICVAIQTSDEQAFKCEWHKISSNPVKPREMLKLLEPVPRED